MMITIFACPKPFHGHVDIIQRNAIKSWTLLQPKAEIILLGDDEGVAEICKEFDLIHVTEIERNERGTPLVSSIFQVGQERASHPVVCYVNADIILMSDLLPAVETVAAHMSDFLIVGQRWDVDIREAWNFASTGWEADLHALLAQTGVLASVTAIDFFAFPRGMYTDIPPFAIGRLCWDNWLLWRARSKGTPVVDATAGVTIVHQNHDYAAGTIERLGERWIFGPEAQRNAALVSDEKGFHSIWSATWVIDSEGALKRRLLILKPAYLRYRLLLALLRRSAFSWLYHQLWRPIKQAIRRDGKRADTYVAH